MEQDFQQTLSRLVGLNSVIITNDIRGGVGKEDMNEQACEWVRSLVPGRDIDVSIVTRHTGVVCLVRV
jgi:hypothetical protein